MKALVCISHVPDTTTKIKYTADGKSLDKNGVTFVINPYDEFGLVRAIEEKEKTGSGSVTVLTVGKAGEVDSSLRKALAIGADDAVLLASDGDLDGRGVAEQIAQYAKAHSFDAIFMGKESIDHNNSEVPGMVAELLGMPFVSLCTKLEIEGDKALMHREVDGGYEKVEATLPVVVSCQKGIAEWRIPNMRGIMMARKKQLVTENYGDNTAYVNTVKLELPPEKSGCEYIDPAEAEKLVSILHDKGII